MDEKGTMNREGGDIHNIKNISWNVKGILEYYANEATGIKITSKGCESLTAEINKTSPDIALMQEPVGTKFNGYIKKKEWQHAEMPGIVKVAGDQRRLTAIYVNHHKIKRCQPMQMPDDLYQDQKPTGRGQAPKT